jgi:Flp pilus assembly protein TadG
MTAKLYFAIRQFAADRRANVMILFGLALLPLLGMTALAVDYSQSLAVKARLDAAADAATIAGITAAQSYIQKYTGTGSVNTQAVTAGNNAAQAQFNANAGRLGVGAQMIANPAAPFSGNYVAVSGQSILGSVSYSYNNPTLLAKLLGRTTVTVANTAKSSLTMAKYLNFYLMVDVSGSMAIPSTESEIERLATYLSTHCYPNPPTSPDPTGNYACPSSLNQPPSHYGVAYHLDNTDKYPFNGNPSFPGYSGGCILACHFTAYNACAIADPSHPTSKSISVPCLGYTVTRNGGDFTNPSVDTVSPFYCQTPGTSSCIQLRVDAVAYAVQQLLSTAQQTATLPNQFGVGLYPFIAYLDTLQPLTTNLSTVSSSAGGLTQLLDNGVGDAKFTAPNGASIELGSGGTHFENALPSMNTIITNSMVGSGMSPGSPLPFVFLITDGAQDYQYQHGGGSWSGSNNAKVMEYPGTPAPSWNGTSYWAAPGSTNPNCDAIKNRGITLAILYIPYVRIPNPTTVWNDEDDAANNNIPYIPPSLQSCASPGFYFTASSPTAITQALQQMFFQSLQSAHITH